MHARDRAFRCSSCAKFGFVTDGSALSDVHSEARIQISEQSDQRVWRGQQPLLNMARIVCGHVGLPVCMQATAHGQTGAGQRAATVPLQVLVNQSCTLHYASVEAPPRFLWVVTQIFYFCALWVVLCRLLSCCPL